MLARCLRRRPNIKTALGQCLVLAGYRVLFSRPSVCPSVDIFTNIFRGIWSGIGLKPCRPTYQMCNPFQHIVLIPSLRPSVRPFICPFTCPLPAFPQEQDVDQKLFWCWTNVENGRPALKQHRAKLSSLHTKYVEPMLARRQIGVQDVGPTSRQH